MHRCSFQLFLGFGGDSRGTREGTSAGDRVGVLSLYKWFECLLEWWKPSYSPQLVEVPSRGTVNLSVG